MPKFSVDYNQLSKSVDKKTFKFKDIAHKLEKVAFDIFRSKDNQEELWEVMSADDGEYIVARYEFDTPKEETKTASPWDVLINKTSGEMNIFYKEYPIIKLAASSLGLAKDDLDSVKSFLPEKLATDNNFVNLLLKNVNTTSRHEIARLFPELSNR